MLSAGSSPERRTGWVQTKKKKSKQNKCLKKNKTKKLKNDLRVNLEQVIVLGIGSEEVSDADHGAAKGPPVLHATLVLLFASSHPPCTTGTKKDEPLRKTLPSSRWDLKRKKSYLFV